MQCGVERDVRTCHCSMWPTQSLPKALRAQATASATSDSLICSSASLALTAPHRIAALNAHWR